MPTFCMDSINASCLFSIISFIFLYFSYLIAMDFLNCYIIFMISKGIIILEKLTGSMSGHVPQYPNRASVHIFEIQKVINRRNINLLRLLEHFQHCRFKGRRRNYQLCLYKANV